MLHHTKPVGFDSGFSSSGKKIFYGAGVFLSHNQRRRKDGG
jgi:hypothetical protein